jgi:hypothetical protein
MPHPDLYSDWRVAKRAAAVLANVVGATLLQKPDGRKRIILGRRVIDSPSWLAAWSFLYRIRSDQVASAKQRALSP